MSFSMLDIMTEYHHCISHINYLSSKINKEYKSEKKVMNCNYAFQANVLSSQVQSQSKWSVGSISTSVQLG